MRTIEIKADLGHTQAYASMCDVFSDDLRSASFSKLRVHVNVLTQACAPMCDLTFAVIYS